MLSNPPPPWKHPFSSFGLSYPPAHQLPHLLPQTLYFLNLTMVSSLKASDSYPPPSVHPSTNPSLYHPPEGAIIPNAFLRTSDAEQFSDDPLEWIRTDLAVSAAGTEGATRRQAAGDVLQALVGCGDNVEIETTRVVGGWVEKMLKEYNEGSGTKWKSKNGAIWLISSVANRGGTTGQGVTSTNKLVDAVQFFERNVFPDLQAQEGTIDEEMCAKGGVHPILKVDAVRFLYTFRNQLTKQHLLAVLPLLGKALDESQSYVTYTYAAIAIERVLGIRQNGQILFTQADVRDFAPQLLGGGRSRLVVSDPIKKRRKVTPCSTEIRVTWLLFSLRLAGFEISWYLDETYVPFMLSSDECFKPAPGLMPGSVTSGFTFSTRIANGKVCWISLVDGDWKASTVFMALDSLKGYEELSVDENLYGGRFPTWSEVREKTWKNTKRYPEVLVVGAGQNGLQIVARFRQMQIPTLVIKRNDRIGDTC
ncbi:hypothetical protein D9757_009601 [Collybiopsis confluens]|uniref:Exportin-2 central domain-containing protein n=1 Tax=Collybiopsis confluens TaxID=2823264 RepID=A0A8H5H4H0_9AGAR|nr:hypothetical protein D9757_009601 [Collybiopsis confluens]